jgi:glycosyltransferase involved in cell wall biosynthesis
MRPLVSVLIPCYNAGPWVAQAVESACAQTWPNLEIIVVNDGSTDNSREILRGFESRPNVRVFDQANRGQTAALNVCLSHARGDFIQYLDADDLLAPDKIEIQMRRLEGRRDCVATSEWARFYGAGAGAPEDARFVPDETWQDLDPVEWITRAFSGGHSMLYPGLWLLPRGIVERIGPWREELTLNNDAEYFTRAALASAGCLFCPGAKAYYRSGLPNTLSATRSRAACLSQVRVLELCEQHLRASEDSERTRRAVSAFWQRVGMALYPHARDLGESAIAHGRALADVTIEPQGGALFRLMHRLLGWRGVLRLRQWRIRLGAWWRARA